MHTALNFYFNHHSSESQLAEISFTNYRINTYIFTYLGWLLIW